MPNLFDLRSGSHQEMRGERIREFITPIRSRPETYDLTGGDDFILLIHHHHHFMKHQHLVIIQIE